LLFSFLSAKKY